MFKFQSYIFLCGTLFLGLSTTGCSQQGFTAATGSGSQYHLFNSSEVPRVGGSGSGTTVGTGGNAGSGSGTTTGSGGNSGSGSGTTTGSGGSSGSGSGTTTGSGTTSTIPVNLYCDTVDSRKAGTNAYSASTVTLTVTDSSDNVVCSITNAESDIQTTASDLNLSGCPVLPPGSYGLSIMAPGSSYNLLIDGLTGSRSGSAGSMNLPLTKNPIPVTIDSNGDWTSAAPIYVLWDSNPKDSATNPGNSLCETDGASPLIIDLNAPSKKPDLVELTSPTSGVLFNILGENAVRFGLPANSPVKISWFKNSNYGLLALPAVDGQVHGIDQLFGNNTQLPDGTYKANGYLALAYYDANHDGVIDQKDPVFSQLRIWKSNVDSYGVATQGGEFLTLKQLGITKINLKYSQVSGNEKKAEGNCVKLRSTATFADGKHDMFDLWFKIQLPEAMLRLAKK